LPLPIIVGFILYLYLIRFQKVGLYLGLFIWVWHIIIEMKKEILIRVSLFTYLFDF
jgi:hypothetical protein